NDRHWGDGGADRFVFDGNDGNDVIIDWGTGADMIEITNGAYSIADLAIDQVGGDTEVSFAGTRITLEGVDAATVGADDFWFS
ncbi:MAG: alkaline metalloproteinase, partial [Pseudomonadota bacterium]